MMEARKKVSIVLILCMLLALSCARDDKHGGAPAPGTGADQGGRPASGNTPPVVVSASLYPPNATAIITLAAQFSGTDAEGDLIQYTFRWFVDGELVQEGKKGSLDPGPYKKGASVYVEIIPADQFSSGIAYKSGEVTIGNLPPVVTSITLAPEDPRAGSVIVAKPVVSDPDGDRVSVKFQWFVNSEAVGEPGESDQFSTIGLRKKDTVAVIITPSDEDGPGSPKASDFRVLVNSLPRITSKPPSGYPKGSYRYQVAADDPDGDRLSYSLVKAPQGMTIDASTGLITWEPKPVTDWEEVMVRINVSDGDGGVVYQEYTLILEPR